MQDIHRARTLADAYMIRDVLAAEGIRATIRNEHLVGIAGDVPVPEALPTIAVADTDAARAAAILRFLHDDSAAVALDRMDGESTTADDPQAQAVMGELWSAAARLVRNPGRGEAVDEVRHCAEVVSTTSAPFGVSSGDWQQIGELAAALVAARDEDAVRDNAARLRDVLTAFV